ncbi:MAG: outer membrane lipoprotein carrier protein LolA [Pseudomonadota bacterium]|nr:outer membrane lipoprotein carrier protein LolA [Pseudomonadota bacterium]MDP1903231.1 outer membrane lipoprotein carrier protein LolA [Pseudomonadota bacterium]MDP2352740.1 outer membrane lipoprotein carrier protein LolA [Pseudomonadota bacterium]
MKLARSIPKTDSPPRYSLLSGCLLLLLSLTYLPPTHAAPVLAQLSARLDKAEVIHAEFTQTKTLQALKRPLRTTGQLVFARGQGVLWRIEKPYQASYALSAERVTEIGPDGARRVRAAREVPALAQVGRVFQAIFQGDINSLEEHFEVTVSGDAERWRVDLAPKPALARFMKGISARGGRFLDLIEVEETQGDRTRIEFRNSRLDAPLSEAEARLLRND